MKRENNELALPHKYVPIPAKRKFQWAKVYRQRYLYMMMAPSLIMVLIFAYIPLAGWIMAFKNYQIGLSIWSAEWVGLTQFKNFLSEGGDWGYLLRNTLVMNIGMLIVNLLMAVVFAILINELRNKRIARVIQTISFFPFFISWVVIYSIMHALFGLSTGIVNQSLIKWGIISEGINILGDPKFAWGLVICISLWKVLGYNGVIFIAAISSISQDQYEAADIDGASRIQKIIHITIPGLMPTLIVLLIMNSGWILNSNFDLFLLFTNTTNWTRMEVLDMYIYKYGLQLTNYSYATAVGIIKSVVSILLLLIVNNISKRSTGKAIL